MGHHQIVQKRCVLFPDFVFFIDNPFFDSIVERFLKKKKTKIKLYISHGRSKMTSISVPFSFGDPDMTKSENYFPSWWTWADNQSEQDGVRIPRQILMSHDHNGPMTYRSWWEPLSRNQNWQNIQTKVGYLGSFSLSFLPIRGTSHCSSWFNTLLCVGIADFLVKHGRNWSLNPG